MRFRSTLMLTAMVSIGAIFALGCPASAMQASPARYAQRQGKTQAPAQGHVQGQPPAPAQSQTQRQVNDRVRELQQQYKDLLKHEYNPAKFHPKATEKPSFNKPGWLNHGRRSRRTVRRSRTRHRYYKRRSSKYWRTRARRRELHRHSRKWTRRHGVYRGRVVRGRKKAEIVRAHRRSRTYSRRARIKRAKRAKNRSAVRKSRHYRSSTRRHGRAVRSSAKTGKKGRRSKAVHTRRK